MGLFDDLRAGPRTAPSDGARDTQTTTGSLFSDLKKPSFRETAGRVLTSPGARSILSTMAQASPITAPFAPLISRPRETFEYLATPKLASEALGLVSRRPDLSPGEQMFPVEPPESFRSPRQAFSHTFASGVMSDVADMMTTPVTYAIPKASEFVGKEIFKTLPETAQRFLKTPISKLKTRNPKAVADDILKAKTFDEALSKWKNVQDDLIGKVGRILFRKNPELIIRFTRGPQPPPLGLPSPEIVGTFPAPVSKVPAVKPVTESPLVTPVLAGQIQKPEQRLGEINNQLLNSVKILDSLRKRKNIDSDFVKSLILEEQAKIKSLLDEQKSLISGVKQEGVMPSALEAGLKRKGMETPPEVVVLPSDITPQPTLTPEPSLVPVEPSQVTPPQVATQPPPTEPPLTPGGPLAEVPGTGPTKTRGLSLGVQEKAIANKLTQGFGELPEFQQVNLENHAKIASDLLAKDPALARRIAMGEEPPPPGLIPEAVFVAVEDQAVRQGDVATLFDLATKSRLTSEATTMGQRLRTLGERDPESPTAALKDIQRTREAAANKRVKDVKKEVKRVGDTIRQEIARARPSRETWESFVRGLECL